MHEVDERERKAVQLVREVKVSRHASLQANEYFCLIEFVLPVGLTRMSRQRSLKHDDLDRDEVFVAEDVRLDCFDAYSRAVFSVPHSSQLGLLFAITVGTLLDFHERLLRVEGELAEVHVAQRWSLCAR